ncbi:glycosyltransferase [Pseudonocardia nematodicida]|uniref:Glycosyltransferase n=1 Tax=Pseudonocardia nematodicida TaxID=1206997 RepID=A0ABV1K3R3_9PSEU
MTETPARPGLRRAHWGVISQGLNTGTSFVLSFLVARSQEPAEFGQFALVLVVLAVALGLVHESGSTVLTIAHAADRDALPRAARRSTGYAGSLGAVVGAACLVAGALVQGPIGPVLLVVGIGMPAVLLQDAVRGYFIAAGRPARAAADDAVRMGTQVLLTAVVLATVPDPPMWSFVAAWAIGAAVASAVGLWWAGLVPERALPHRWLADHRTLALPLLAMFALTSFPSQAVIVLMPLVSDLDQTGALRAAYLLFGPMGMLFGAVYALALVDGVRAGGPAEVVRIGRRVSVLLAAVAVAWGLIVVFLPAAVGRQLIGPSWDLTGTTRLVLGLSLVAEGVIFGATTVMGALRRPRLMVWARLLSAPVMLLAALGLASGLGATGAAIGLTIGYTTCALLAWARVPGAARQAAADPANTGRPERVGSGTPAPGGGPVMNPVPASRLAVAVTSPVTAAAFLPGLVGHMVEAGWEVTVICAPGTDLEVLEAAGAAVRTVAMSREPDPRADLRSLRELSRVLAEVRPDVLLSATPKAGLLATLAARRRRVPVVVHLMWGLRSETLTGLRRGYVRALETVTGRLSRRVLANSHSLGHVLVGAGIVSAGRLDVLGAGSSHGVDVDRFVPADRESDPGVLAAARALRSELDRLGDGPVVGFIGRLTPDKGVHELVEAVRLLHRRGTPCRLVLAGPVEDGRTGALLDAAVTEGLPILLAGGVADPRPVYRVTDVHCLPTWREGFPNVCLEAAACGLPTVTTDATGAVDSVLDGRTGAMVPVRDPEALAGAIAGLLADPARRSRLGTAARERVEREYAAPVVHRAHHEYLVALHRRAGGRWAPAGRAPVGTPDA